jgi:hypothetical protein
VRNRPGVVLAAAVAVLTVAAPAYAGTRVRAVPCPDGAVLLAGPVTRLPGQDFTERLRQYQNDAVGEDSPDSFDDADRKMRDLQPCNREQAAYRDASLAYLGWLAAAAACRDAYYEDAQTLGDVSAWLACIGPVNAALVSAAREAADLHFAALQAPCSPGYSASPAPPNAGLIYRQVVGAAKVIGDAIDAVETATRLGALAKDGVTLLIDPVATPEDVDRFATEIRTEIVMQGKAVLTGAVHDAGAEAAALALEPVTSAVDAAITQVEVRVTAEGPDGDVTTQRPLSLTGS